MGEARDGMYPDKTFQREGIERTYPIVISGYERRIIFHGVRMRVKDNHADAAVRVNSKMAEHKGAVVRVVV
jgi:hypothetical protein